MNLSEWTYFKTDEGDSTDARQIPLHGWQNIYDEEDAAKYAWEHIWNDAGGDYGIGEGPNITVISPTGELFEYTTSTETTVEYYVNRTCMHK